MNAAGSKNSNNTAPPCHRSNSPITSSSSGPINTDKKNNVASHPIAIDRAATARAAPSSLSPTPSTIASENHQPRQAASSSTYDEERLTPSPSISISSSSRKRSGSVGSGGGLFRLDEASQSMGFDIKGNSDRGAGGGLILSPQHRPHFDKLRGGLNFKVDVGTRSTSTGMDVDAPERDGSVSGSGKGGSSNNASPAPPSDTKGAGPATPAPSSDNGGESSGDDAATPSPASPGKKNDAAKSNDESDAAEATASKAESIFNSKISFPLNLTRMLEAVEKMGKEHIVHWGEDEKSFVIVDIDAFLSEVLPKFFKSSENTKIRSFYRKLNRWGFSMSRKKVNNPHNVWSHPDFHRPTAVKALAEALDKGKAIDFLNMSALTRGKKRRGTDASKDLEMGDEDDLTSLMDGSSYGGDGLSIGGLSRTQSHTSWNNLNMTSIASMPILPSARGSFSNLNKRGRLNQMASAGLSRGLSSRNKLQQHQPGGGQTQGGNGRLLSQSVTASNLRRSQSQMISGGRVGGGGANATFDLVRPSSNNNGGGGSAQQNAAFNLLTRGNSSSGPANPMFDLSALTQGAGGGSAGVAMNSTFSNLLASRVSGMPQSSNNLAPSTNFFARSAQEMLNGTLPNNNNTVNNIDALLSQRNAINKTANPNFAASPFSQMQMRGNSNSSSPFATPPFSSMNSQQQQQQGSLPPPRPMPHGRTLQREMTPDEDSELSSFLGNFAITLPPPQETDEDYGEPDPLPGRF